MRQPVLATMTAGGLGLALLGLSLLCAALARPWVVVGVGGSEHVFGAWQLLPLALPVVVGLLVAACGIGASGPARRHRFPLPVGLALLAVLGLTIATIELVSATFPRDLVPVHLRRFTVEARAGAGLWLALAAAGVVAAAALPPARRFALLTSPVHARRASALLALVLALTALAVLRYQPWASGHAVGQEMSVEAWAMPWIGPLSLAPVWALAFATVAVATGRRTTAALLAAGAGWLATVSAASVVLAASVFGRLNLDALLPETARAYAPEMHVTTATWLVFATGCATAASAALFLIPLTGHGDV